MVPENRFDNQSFVGEEDLIRLKTTKVTRFEDDIQNLVDSPDNQVMDNASSFGYFAKKDQHLGDIS